MCMFLCRHSSDFRRRTSIRVDCVLCGGGGGGGCDGLVVGGQVRLVDCDDWVGPRPRGPD